MASVETIAGNKRQRLKDIEAEYIRTRDYLKSPQWAERRDKILQELSICMGGYRAGMDGVAAAYVLGQAKQILLEIHKLTDVIVEYDSLKDELERYHGRLDVTAT